LILVSDTNLQLAVMKALSRNPRVRSDEIAAQARDGDVTLRGTVGSLVQKGEAADTTRSVPGVRRVDDRLAVRLMGIDGRADADTEAAVFDALMADEHLHANEIDVEVRDGTVTLRGPVELPAQRDLAERIALAVPGVLHVENRLHAWLTVDADDIAERVTDAIGVGALVGADRITVRVEDNDVTLTGTVTSQAHRDTALAVAAGTRGVANVRDELAIAERC
jgi:osmotically-inducible protein OsmY